jgi:hypothetical protein
MNRHLQNLPATMLSEIDLESDEQDGHSYGRTDDLTKLSNSHMVTLPLLSPSTLHKSTMLGFEKKGCPLGLLAHASTTSWMGGHASASARLWLERVVCLLHVAWLHVV